MSNVRRRLEGDQLKRALDLLVSVVLLGASAPILLPAVCVAALETKRSGLFRQTRIGRNGDPFELLKVRTMREVPSQTSTVTTSGDSRITRSGRLIRRFKLDELPQILNVIRGEMSLVGPRPDVPGFADLLEGDERRILSVRPGITGPAALAYRHEERLLASVEDPEAYNREVIWPDKVRINLDYVERQCFRSDLHYLAETARSVLRREGAPS